MTEQKHLLSWRRLLAAALVVVIVLAALLALDLANHGLAWRTMWSLTGEEAPIAQLFGMVDWLGNLTETQPNTAPDVPIRYTGVNPYGMNTFLEQEVEPVKRERQVQMIAEAGFHWIRQEIPWEDIEIAARGDFQDRRNPSIGVVDAWAKYDNIVDLVDQYGLELEARIDKPPKWTRANQDAINFTPPDNWDDYINFLTTFAERYKGRIHYYQIWNEPNIYPEWGENAVNPEEYTQVLCRAYAALKQVDPSNVVISAALSPTNALTSRDLNEFIFLQRMYDAGAKGCFDIMATQGYGFFSGPTDQRLRPTTLTFARNIYLRDVMVANDDASTPIWIGEAAWNPVDAPDVPDMPLKDQFGSVTPDQAARYMPLAYDRAQQDMPWLGVINYWFFKRPSDDDKNQPYYYFRMVEPDFTPLPVYDSMKQHIADETPTLYAGVHQADDWAIQPDAEAETVSAVGRAVRHGAASQTGDVHVSRHLRQRPLDRRDGRHAQYPDRRAGRGHVEGAPAADPLAHRHAGRLDGSHASPVDDGGDAHGHAVRPRRLPARQRDGLRPQRRAPDADCRGRRGARRAGAARHRLGGVEKADLTPSCSA